MIIKSVAFNTKDPDQKAMLEHANQRPNFSSYIKRLIQRDMEGTPFSEAALEIEEKTGVRELVGGLI